MADEKKTDEETEITPADEIDQDVDLADDGDGDGDDVEIEAEAKPEEAPKKKKKRSSKKNVEKGLDPAEAAMVNPKRASAMKKTASLVENILDGAKLETEDHITKAWKKLNEQVDTKKSTKYTLAADYEQNMVIKHKVFGVGFVNRKLSPTKIEVIFEDGMRRLTCNR